MYPIEYSKSSRAECKVCKSKIAKSCLRVGKMVYYEDLGEMGRAVPVWFHWTCFWGAQYKPGRGDASREWSSFYGIETLNIEDQQMIHLQLKGVPMEDDEVQKVKEKKDAEEAIAQAQKDQKKKDSEEANAALRNSDPETLTYSMITKQLAAMKVVDIKEAIKTHNLDTTGKKKTKKADLIQVIMDQSVDKISNLAYESLNKNLTISSLKEILQGSGLSSTGTKKDLILRLLQSIGGVDNPQNIVIAEKPAPVLSSKEMGPDEDMVHEEWPRLQPYVSIGSNDDVKTFLVTKTKPRHLKIAKDFSIKYEEFNSLISSCGLELIVLEAGDSDTGCGLDKWAAAVIADHCPRLQKLSLDSCSFSDEDLIRVGHCCPRLRYLMVSGNNKVSGNIGKKFLMTFKEERSFLKKLRILDLTDQSCDYTQLEKMSKCRKSVLVRNGDSGDDRWYMPNFGGDSHAMMGGKYHFES